MASALGFAFPYVSKAQQVVEDVPKIVSQSICPTPEEIKSKLQERDIEQMLAEFDFKISINILGAPREFRYYIATYSKSKSSEQENLSSAESKIIFLQRGNFETLKAYELDGEGKPLKEPFASLYKEVVSAGREKLNYSVIASTFPKEFNDYVPGVLCTKSWDPYDFAVKSGSYIGTKNAKSLRWDMQPVPEMLQRRYSQDL